MRIVAIFLTDDHKICAAFGNDHLVTLYAG
jgi:hypothetical protein